MPTRKTKPKSPCEAMIDATGAVTKCSECSRPLCTCNFKVVDGKPYDLCCAAFALMDQLATRLVGEFSEAYGKAKADASAKSTTAAAASTGEVRQSSEPPVNPDDQGRF